MSFSDQYKSGEASDLDDSSRNKSFAYKELCQRVTRRAQFFF
jgi:hypothetical protein